MREVSDSGERAEILLFINQNQIQDRVFHRQVSGHKQGIYFGEEVHTVNI